MKRVLLYLLAMAPLVAFAQMNGSGYYRVQNCYTKRYMSVVDTKADIEVGASVANQVWVDLEAIYMISDFENAVACNPATICYIDMIDAKQINFIGQNLDLYEEVGRYLNISVNGDKGYNLYASVSGAGMSVRRYLIDNTYHGTCFCPDIAATNSSAMSNWNIIPVDQDDSRYLGVKPDVTASADGSYWATMYAGFPFKSSATGTKVYIVSKVDYNNGFAVIKEVTGDVPVQTPVLFRCGAAIPSGNKLTLLASNPENSLGTNYLQGNYYCNNVEGIHKNVKGYDKNTMRMLGTTADGKPAFVKSDIQYLPANKCYLAVNSSAPDVLQIVTEEEYATGINELEALAAEKPQVIYDLQGRRIATPSKGLYIVNGKKMVIK